MAPVSFFRKTGRPVQPYFISPWQMEKTSLAEPVLVPLRGDFFCMPFGDNAEPLKGEKHFCHGEPAGARWEFDAASSEDGVNSLFLRLKTKVRPGRISKRFWLVDGQNVVYVQHVLEGYSGRMPLGHHASLRLPDEEGAARVAVSPFRFGMTAPSLFSDPAKGAYQSFAIGRRFRDLRRVPLLTRDPAFADATAHPARTGFEDLLQIYARQTDEPAWTTLTNQAERYLWFALKDPAMLPATTFWISNKGRHGIPWNGRSRCLGLEEVCGYFADGLKASGSPNQLNRMGISTSVELSPRRPTVVNYIQGAARIPDGFDVVKTVSFGRREVTFKSASGKKIAVAVNHEFLRTEQV